MTKSMKITLLYVVPVNFGPRDGNCTVVPFAIESDFSSLSAVLLPFAAKKSDRWLANFM